MSTEAPGVRTLQQWMMRVVTHHEGIESGLQAAAADGIQPAGGGSLEDIVLANDRQGSREQLQIYAYMYFARLIEVLEGEYPSLLFLLGEDRFARIARSYLRDHPSSHYNLGRLSAAFPEYIARIEDSDIDTAFASALARVERAMEDIIDEPAEDPITYDALSTVAMERWAGARLRPIQAMRLLQLSHPVNPFMNALREESFAPVPSPREVAMCVHRHGFQVYRHELEIEQFHLLSELQGGARLGEAIESVALMPGADTAKLMAAIAGWFESWMADDLFAAIDFD